MAKRQIFLPTDGEANGPIVPDYSLLAFASVAFTFERGKPKELGSFTRNLELLHGPDEVGHPDQMSWWLKFPDAWAAIRENPQPPEKVMRDYHDWLQDLNGEITFVARPDAYDHAMIRYYYIHFLGVHPPFGHRGLDIASYTMGMFRLKRLSDAGRYMDKFRDPSLPHPHIPLPDAIDEGVCFRNLYIENMRRARAEHERAQRQT